MDPHPTFSHLLRKTFNFCVVAWIVLLGPGTSQAQRPSPSLPETTALPSAEAFVAAESSELRDLVDRFADDRAALLRRYDAPQSPARVQRLRTFYKEWENVLGDVDFKSLGEEGQIDYVLLKHELRYLLYELDREEKLAEEMQPYLPFSKSITDLFEAWRDDPAIDPAAVGDTLSRLAKAVRATLEDATTARQDSTGGVFTQRIVAFRAANALEDLKETLEEWYAFYDSYDPLFTWWTAQPYEAAHQELDGYAAFLRSEIVGIEEGEDPPIIGDPIGAAAMEADLAHEMIPYTPQELIAIAEKEFSWCEQEMLKASRDMGYGEDWKAALEKVKTLHVEPGEQPELVRDLAEEAIAFLETHDLVTVPPLAEEIWRMTMMSPEQQKVAPFFLGGEVVRIAFPAEEMAHEDKLMSMRGNNRHFSRAVVFHELIPGHHLQGFMTTRYNEHRSTFSTPFWGEGWALYWEMLLWDMDFPQTPEDRVGMLFWRMHRAARIIFSLRFHLGEMTPQEAIDFLVDRVGHERANATAEVRRSFNGSYPPLYQAAYMLGGLQFKALHEALVENGEMTNRAFHDAILTGGRMPVEMVRMRLLHLPLSPDYETQWKFAEAAPID